MFPVSSEFDDQKKVERRRRPRERMCVNGTVYLGAWRESSPCVVRDMHEDGARLRLIGSYSENQLEVEVDVFDERRKGRVVWSSGQDLGVTFDLGTDTTDHQIRALRDTLHRMRG